MPELTARQYETLGELEAANRNLTEVGYRDGWAKPMDCGASNGSHHSQTLTKLHRRGLIDRKGYTPGCRAVWTYKINDVGKAALAHQAIPRQHGGQRRTLRRLKAKTKIDEVSGCWNWTGPSSGKGYAQISIGGRPYMVHRVSYEIHRGQIPDGLFACHSCDNPACINPDHLFLGTQADNMADMIAKGRERHPIGTDCVSAKLSEDQVISIRAETGMSQHAMAAKYGISRPQISNIRRGKNWVHIP